MPLLATKENGRTLERLDLGEIFDSEEAGNKNKRLEPEFSFV